MLRNSRFAYMNPWVLLIGSIGLMIGTMSVNYHTNPVLKHVLYAGFMGTMALSLVPLINMYAMPVIFDALFATSFTMAGLGLVAYNAPSESFLKYQGMLGMALAGMIGINLINIFFPSRALFNIWLYGGVLLFSAFTLFDVQKIIYHAKTERVYDPINQSLRIYLDFINLFQHILIILGNRKK